VKRVLLFVLLIGVLAVAVNAGSAPQAPAPQSAAPGAAATAGRVDFARDVQPILQKHCYECHGPERQSNGLRLDRRKSVFMGGTEIVLGRGSANSSKLYLRLIGPGYGEQMPKDGTLSPADIDTIKNWIDQGAEWPDEVSGDPPASPNGGTTPLMVAALRGDAGMVRRLLASGANPNAANDAGATALMWAVTSVAVTRVLVDAGADINARSADARTPLLIACGVPGARPVAQLLIERGARLDARAPWLGEQLSCLSEAARIGDATLVRQVMPPTVKPDQVRSFGFPLAMAIRAQCEECIDAITKGTPSELLSGVMAMSGPPGGDASATTALLARGADPKVVHPFAPGMNMLMVAAASDTATPDLIRALLDRGVDPKAVGPGGMTALAIARKRGPTPIVDLLLKAGATETAESAPVPPAPAPAASPRAAIARSLPLLQRADDVFLRKTGCVSCHNNSLTAMTVALARQHRIAIDESIARAQLRKSAEYLDNWRDRSLQNHGIPGDVDSVGYVLMGLAAERHAPDAATEAMARFIRLQQSPNGSWLLLAHRPPIESSEIEVTVSAIRSLQVYAPAWDRAAADAAIGRAVAWLKRAVPQSNEDHAFHVLGLAWGKVDKPAIRVAAKALIARQRADGGWSQLPYLDADAYATGQSLVALVESGALTVADPVYQRGVQFLLKSQLADGSWFVRSRAIAIQPPLDADFPHGKDQFISAAATNWATQALLHAIGKPGS
jgi:ankyrin repeat protein